jgi:cytochrome c-type biogenesis protein CcmH
MIWFWVIAGLLVAAALAALLRPLVRGAGEGGDQGDTVVAVFRRELANIDAELAQGRLAAEEAEEARAEATRRMLAAADAERENASITVRRPAEISWRVGAAVAIAAIFPAAALAIYAAVGAPGAIDSARTAAKSGNAGPHDRAELAAVAEQLKTRLQSEPGHVEGWVLLGRTFTSLGRFAEARDAYSRAITLAPNEPRLHAALGEVLVLAAGGAISPEAEAEFAKSGNNPRARFYAAEAALQRGDIVTAKAGLRALLADAPADAAWRQAVAERLGEIEAANARAAESPSRATGPTAQDVATAQSMSPEQRQAMIRGMVDRLAARLEQNPNDKEGWARLAHDYDVLGETDKAEAARARAAAAVSAPSAAPTPAK